MVFMDDQCQIDGGFQKWAKYRRRGRRLCLAVLKTIGEYQRRGKRCCYTVLKGHGYAKSSVPVSFNGCPL